MEKEFRKKMFRGAKIEDFFDYLTLYVEILSREGRERDSFMEGEISAAEHIRAKFAQAFGVPVEQEQKEH